MATTSPWPLIHAEREALIADLGTLTDEQWDLPSLCEGWSVHDVVLHIAWHSHTTSARFFSLLGFGVSEVAHRRTAVKDMLDVFVREGSTNAIADRLTPFDEYNRFLRLATEIAGVIAFRCE